MANLQPSYGTQARLFVGQIANEEKYNAVSRTVESAAGIAFGQPAFRGANDHGVVVGASGSLPANFMGLAVLDPAVPVVLTGNADAYPQYDTGSFMTFGQTAVIAGASVADGDPVYWNSTTTRYTNVNTDIRIPGAYFDTTGTNGTVVEVSIGNRRHPNV